MKRWTKEMTVENGKEGFKRWNQPGTSHREGGLKMKITLIFFFQPECLGENQDPNLYGQPPLWKANKVLKENMAIYH